jgi:putative ABC transport system permease protein
MSVIVRARLSDADAIRQVRETLRALDPDVPLFFIRSMSDVAGEIRFQIQGMASLIGFLATIAFLLAIVGLYAVAAHAVTQRTVEVGIRMGLGATRTQITTLFLRQTGYRVIVGLLLGLGGAIATGKVMQRLLLHTSPADPLTLSCVALMLAVVSVAASLVPAHRAARLDPAVTLRHD